MPVYERGYRHWEPSGRREAAPWWVIARRGILAPLRTRRFLALLLLAWVPAIVKGVILYFSFQAGDLMKLLGGSWASVDAPGFFAFLEKQRGFVLIVLAIIGTPLVARDRSENGLALYFARPLTLRDYVLGKLLIVLFYFLIVTLAPVLLLALFGYLVTSGATGPGHAAADAAARHRLLSPRRHQPRPGAAGAFGGGPAHGVHRHELAAAVRRQRAGGEDPRAVRRAVDEAPRLPRPVRPRRLAAVRREGAAGISARDQPAC